MNSSQWGWSETLQKLFSEEISKNQTSRPQGHPKLTIKPLIRSYSGLRRSLITSSTTTFTTQKFSQQLKSNNILRAWCERHSTISLSLSLSFSFLLYVQNGLDISIIKVFPSFYYLSFLGNCLCDTPLTSIPSVLKFWI